MIGCLCLAANLAMTLGFLPAIPETAFGPKSAIERAMERYPGSWIELLVGGTGQPVQVGNTIVVEFTAVDSRGITVADSGARGMPLTVRVEEGSDWHLLSFEMRTGETRRVTYRPVNDKNTIFTVTLRLIRCEARD